MSTLVLAAHGSADPRSPATVHAVANRVRDLRPGLDVRVGFCERSTPNLRDVLAGLPGGADVVVAPLLLASAYHAGVDMPALIDASGVRRRGLRVRQASVLGEDRRLVRVAHERLAELGVSRLDDRLGVLLVAVGSSRQAANLRTATVAPALARGTRWAGVVTAFATGPRPALDEAARRLRRRGAHRLVVAPWFLAPGRLTDRVHEHARSLGMSMAAPLGPHPLVAATVLGRFDRVAADDALAA